MFVPRHTASSLAAIAVAIALMSGSTAWPPSGVAAESVVPTYTDANLAPNQAQIKAVYLTELRAAIAAIW